VPFEVPVRDPVKLLPLRVKVPVNDVAVTPLCAGIVIVVEFRLLPLAVPVIVPLITWLVVVVPSKVPETLLPDWYIVAVKADPEKVVPTVPDQDPE
jgi:hypothetical protein